MSDVPCGVRGCVALVTLPNHLCPLHKRMAVAERGRWSQEHSFNLPVLRSVSDGRIVYQRTDGTCFRIGSDGEAIEERL
jgi:hypothetical protein